jgi:hypothetical protein
MVQGLHDDSGKFEMIFELVEFAFGERVALLVFVELPKIVSALIERPSS